MFTADNAAKAKYVVTLLEVEAYDATNSYVTDSETYTVFATVYDLMDRLDKYIETGSHNFNNAIITDEGGEDIWFYKQF
jgi:hypothetical protein